MNITFTFSVALHKLTYFPWQFAFSVIEARNWKGVGHVHCLFKVHHTLWGRLRTHVIQLTSLCLSVKVYAFTIEILTAEFHARFHS